MSTSLTSSIEKLVTTLELRAIREAAYSKNKEAMDSSSEIAETIRHHLSSLQQHSEALAGAMQEWMTHHNQSSVADCECAKCTLIREALAKYRIAFPSPQTHE